MADETYGVAGFYVKQGASTAVVASTGAIHVESNGYIRAESGSTMEVVSGAVLDIESGGALRFGGSAFRSSDNQFKLPSETHSTAGTLDKDLISYISSAGQSTTTTYVLPVGSSGAVKYVVVGDGGGATGCVVLRTAATSCSFDGTNNIATFTTEGNVTLQLWCLSTNRWAILNAVGTTGPAAITFSAGA